MAAQAGKSARASDPTRRRARCGTISPMKPTSPAKTTLLAASSAEAARMTHWARSTSSADGPCAQLADPKRVQRCTRDDSQQHAHTDVRRGDGQIVPAASRHRAGEPRQNRARIIARLRAHDGERDDRGEERGERNAGEDQASRVDSAAAARKRRDEQRGAESGNKADAPASRRLPRRPEPQVAIAAADAALTPMRYGSANGLRSMPWSNAPHSANDAPTVAPMHTRGRRSCQTIALSTPD